MNKFKTLYNGGLPLTLDDFRWIDDSYRSALYGILSGFGVADQTTFILSGCAKTISGGIVTIAEGYVSLGGEICFVPTHTYSEPTGGDVDYWVLDLSYDSAGNKVFQNSDLNSTYEVRVAQLTVGSTVPAGSTSYALTKTFFGIIEEKLDKSNSYNLDDANMYASSKAVKDLNAHLMAYIISKQDMGTAMKFVVTGSDTSPSPVGKQLGDVYFVGDSVPYLVYIFNGSGWNILT